MPNASTLQFLLTLAKGIASQFGPNCEVVVHDLATNDPERSIVAIENGHVTGRKVGDGPSHVVLEALRGNPEQLHDHLSYLTRTKDGKILKSTTIYIRDDDGAPIGIFGINYDITLMLAMENAIKQFTATEKDEKEPEPIARNVSDLLDELIEQSVKVVGKPVALMNKEDKVKAVQFLNETGASSSPRAATGYASSSVSPSTLCTATLTNPRRKTPQTQTFRCLLCLLLRQIGCKPRFAADLVLPIKR